MRSDDDRALRVERSRKGTLASFSAYHRIALHKQFPNPEHRGEVETDYHERNQAPKRHH